MTFGAASAKERIDVVVRNSIHAGDIPGPRSLANGQEVPTRCYCKRFLYIADAERRQMAPREGALVAGITRYVDSEEEIVAAINEFAELGVNQVKFSMSGEEITEHIRAEDTTFPDELVAAGVEVSTPPPPPLLFFSLCCYRYFTYIILFEGCSRQGSSRLFPRQE